MDRQNQNQTVSQSPTEEQEQKSKKERVKATFSILDRVVKAYNEGETYVKRGLTLFGLGSLIAGISFGAGQQISQQEVNTAKDVNGDSTAEVRTTSQPIIHHSIPTPPPSVIYVTPVPGQHSFTHTPVPTATSPTVSNSSVQPALNPAPKPQSSTITTNSSGQSAPQSIPSSKPSTIPDSPEVQPVVTKPPIIDRPESISSVLSDVQQAVEPLQQVSGIFSGLKETVEPWAEESDDD